MPDEAQVNVPIRDDGLQLEEHRVFQDGFWVAERVGWGCFALVILLALAGLTGRGGYFADFETRAGVALVEMPRVARRGETAVLHVAFGRNGGRHLLALDGAFLSLFEVEGVSPHPLRSVAAGEGVALQFEAVGPAPHHARLHIRALRAGWAEVRVVADGSAVPARLLILP